MLGTALPVSVDSRFTLKNPIQKSRKLIFVAGWGVSAFTHWNGRKTTLHKTDDTCSCGGAIYPRLESFHFCAIETPRKPFIVRLSTNATIELWQSHKQRMLKAGESIELLRLIPAPGNPLNIQRCTGIADISCYDRLTLTRENLVNNLCRILGMPRVEATSVFS